MSAFRRAGAAAVAGLLALIAGGVRLGSPGLWIDEIYTARWTRLDATELIAALRTDLHPPLYFVLESAMVHWVGSTESGLRFLPLLAGAAAAALATWSFAPSLGDRRAFFAGLLVALSPQFMLYARMARYYSLAAMFVVLAHGAFERLARSPRDARWRAAYAVAGGAVLWTSYAAAVVLVAHGVRAWRARGERRGLPRAWTLAIAGSALTFVPWIPILVAQFHVEHALVGAVGGRAAPVAMAAYAAYAFTAGELLKPWTLAGAAGALAGVIVLAAGLRSAIRLPSTRLPVLTGLLAAAFSLALLGLAVRGTPFIVFPGRALFLWPFVAAALACAPARPVLRFALVVLGAAWATAWAQLYAAKDWLDPLYLTPGREVAAVISAASLPGDLVLAEDDTGVPYYLERAGFPGRMLDPVRDPAVEAALANPAPPRLWYARLSRDGSARVRPGGAAAERVARWGTLEGRWGFLAADPRELELKRRLLGLEGWRWRIVLERRSALLDSTAHHDFAGTSSVRQR